MDAKQIFGVKLRELRLSRGLTQEDLAEKVSRSVDALSKLERGKGFPSLDTAVELSKQLQLPLAKLLAPFEQGASRAAQRVQLEAKAEALLSQLDDRRLSIAIEQIKALTRK